MQDSRDWAGGTRPWRPMATYVLLATMLAVYIAQQVSLGYLHPFAWHGLTHQWPDFLFVINTDWMWRPWTLLSSTLAHDFVNPNHLIFNGMFLFFFGPAVERLLGWKRFVTLFLVAGAVAGVAQVHAVAFELTGHLMGYLPDGGALGASGGLMALFGLLIVLTPNQKVALFMIVPMPLWIAGIGYAALDVLGVVSPRFGGNIGHFAHLSGMAVGLLYGLVVKAAWKRRGVRLVYG